MPSRKDRRKYEVSLLCLALRIDDLFDLVGRKARRRVSLTWLTKEIGAAEIIDFHQREPAMSWPWPSLSHALRMAAFILLMCATVSGSVVANTS